MTAPRPDLRSECLISDKGKKVAEFVKTKLDKHTHACRTFATDTYTSIVHLSDTQPPNLAFAFAPWMTVKVGPVRLVHF